MHSKRTVCVVGLGYIGLPTSALLASGGYQVVGVDVDARVIETINQGRIHIVEPDLDAYVRSAVAAGKLAAFAKPAPADVFMICVPTPFHEGGGDPQPNIDHVLEATRSIAPHVRPGNLVILESTSPVGTTAKVAATLRDEGVDVSQVHVAYCPERVLPGRVMSELVENDRVVGGLRSDDTGAVASFYREFVRGEVLETDAATAEMCKLTENSFRDTNIAFANELSIICARAGIDVWKLIALANRHPRVNVLQPGAGVGGHCIAVDPWFIVASDPANARLIRTAREVNNRKAQWVVEEIARAADALAARLGRAPTITCLGLAFKPDIDDLRESPAVGIVEALAQRGYRLRAVEPNIDSHRRFALASLEESMHDTDLFAALVRHRPFLQAAQRGVFADRSLLDFCGLLAD